ncbi:MAG TPA: hypothetical protein ENN91_03440 [Firmicutes bacterium]|nr:hypothetical protein [Bacillota bacterium]
MEATIVLVVLIILFNLFSTLVRAARRRKSSPPRKPVPGRSRFDRPEFIEPPEISVGYDPDMQVEAGASSFYGQWVSDQEADEPAEEEDYGDKPEEELFPGEREKFSEDELPQEKPPVREARQAAPLAAGLRQALKDKDSLVSAFVFHELIGPPVSQRKRR